MIVSLRERSDPLITSECSVTAAFADKKLLKVTVPNHENFWIYIPMFFPGAVVDLLKDKRFIISFEPKSREVVSAEVM